MHQKYRMTKLIKLCVLFTFIFSYHYSSAEETPASIHTQFTSEPIILDGHLDESIWSELKHIKNFIQRDPAIGEPASENTEVAVAYDKNNLYIGVWCYQEDASSIVAKFMQRDFDDWSVDNFKVVISPFNDDKNGYLFIVNPLGARTDAQVISSERANRNWNGVWDVRTQITDKGWFAEIMIPFNTFQFKNVEEHTWAINFERNIKSKNEEVIWQGWSRNHSINSIETIW